MDVKMFDFFCYMGIVILISVIVLLIVSLFICYVWCCYFCLYGVLMGVVLLLLLFKICCNVESCIDCGKCVKNCLLWILVDKLI